jgi:hypothetical protein
MKVAPRAAGPVGGGRSPFLVQRRAGHAMAEWQGPFDGLQGLLEAWAWSAVVAVVLVVAAAVFVVRTLHRESDERSEIG